MTKNPSRKRSKVFVLIFPRPQVIRIHFSEWEVYRPRTPRGMRIFVLIIPQVIQIYFAESEVVAILLNFDR